MTSRERACGHSRVHVEVNSYLAERRTETGGGGGSKVPNAHSTVEAIKTTVAHYSLPSCTYHVSVMTYFDNSEREM